MSNRISKKSQPQPQQSTKPVKKQTGKQKEKVKVSDLLSKGAAFAVAPLAVAAGAATITVKFWEGVLTKKPIDQAVSEGIDATNAGADMLKDMWNGKYF